MKKIKFIVVLVLTVISCQRTNKNNTEKSNIIMEFVKSDKMDKAEFWKIIKYSIANSKDNKSEQEKIIIEKLSAYSPQQIIEFEIILRQLIIEADDYKLMAAQKNH